MAAAIIRVVQKLQFLNNFRLKTANSRAFFAAFCTTFVQQLLQLVREPIRSMPPRTLASEKI
jgi:hypothetical protein